jgi:hypothetical protein
MPMPGMMPKQGAPTPPAMVGPLTQMHLDQLMQLMLNPRPDGPPLYAVISAITEKQKQAQAQANMQRQMAMAQGQQAAQQPPVAQQVMQAAMQQAPVGAAQGGIMQGYAGGGAVAFGDGGPVQKFQYGTGPRGVMANPAILSSIDGVPIYRPSEGPEAGETEEQYRARKEREAAEADEVANRPLRRLYRYLEQKIREPSPVAQMRTAAAPTAAAATETVGTRQGKSGIADLDIGPSMAPSAPRPPGATRPGTGIAQGQNRSQAAPPAPAPGIAGLMGPTAPAGLIERRGAQQAEEAALRNAAKTPEEALRARQEADRLRQGIVGLYETEEARRSGALDKLVSDAQARYSADRFSNPEILGRMLRGAMAAGPRARAGQVLAGMGAGAMEGVSSLQNAVTAAQKEQALGQERLFDMRMRREQLRIDQANLMEARASKDQDRINAAEIKVAESRQSLAEAERKAAMEERKFGLDERQVAVQEAGLKLRQDEAKRGPTPSFQDQMARGAIEDWLKKNPGKTYSDAVEWWRGAGKGVEGRERLGNLKLASETLSKRLEDLRLSKDERDRITNQLQGVQAEILSLLGMSGTSAAPSQGAPAVGTVMQGYRFKGGNPADKNNWEKV